MKGYRKYSGPDGSATFINPLDIEIEPGKRVRDLPDLMSCTHAIAKLSQDINDIAGQIDRAETSANKPPLEWFAKAMKAKRWKKRAMKAIRAHAAFLRQTDPTHSDLGELQRENEKMKNDLTEERSHRQKLQIALAFWMPSVSEPIEIITKGRCGDDACLLAGSDAPFENECWGDEIYARALAAEAEVTRLKQDGLYIAGFETGWEAAVGEPINRCEGDCTPVDKSNNGEN